MELHNNFGRGEQSREKREGGKPEGKSQQHHCRFLQSVVQSVMGCGLQAGCVILPANPVSPYKSRERLRFPHGLPGAEMLCVIPTEPPTSLAAAVPPHRGLSMHREQEGQSWMWRIYSSGRCSSQE